MRRSATTSRSRVGALAGGCLILLVGAALATAQPVDRPAPTQRGQLALERVHALRVHRLPPRPAAVFPVRGQVGCGEAAARFGASRSGHSHEGQDVFAPAGTPLLAVRDGVVLETGDGGGRGNYVAIFSPARRETYVYLHMQSPATVAPGQRVRAGRRVGRLGCTGSCFGDHLHLEVRRGRSPEGTPRDPLPLLLHLQRARRR